MGEDQHTVTVLVFLFQEEAELAQFGGVGDQAVEVDHLDRDVDRGEELEEGRGGRRGG